MRLSYAKWKPHRIGGVDRNGRTPQYIVWHCTETSDLPSYAGGASSPEFTLDLLNVVLYQHIDTDMAGRALRNQGGTDANRRSVQIELIGGDSWARNHKKILPKLYDFDSIPEAGYQLWGKLTRDISDYYGIPLRIPEQGFTDAYDLQTGKYRAPYRMSLSEYLGYRGILGHQHVPNNDHCVTSSTQILMADYTWKTAGELETGDRLVGFDENENILAGDVQRRFKEAIAIVHTPIEKECYKIQTKDGRKITCSFDHKWLVGVTDETHGIAWEWVATKDLSPDIHKIVGVEVSAHNDWIGRTLGEITQNIWIDSVTAVGAKKLISLETSTKTYIAEGLLTHNTDPGSIDVNKVLKYAGGAIIPDSPDEIINLVEESNKMGLTGFYYKRDDDNTYVYFLINHNSGFFLLYTGSIDGGPIDGEFNNKIAKAFNMGDWTEISQSLGEVMAAAAEEVRSGK